MADSASAPGHSQAAFSSSSTTLDLEKRGSSELALQANGASSEDIPTPKPSGPNPADFPDGGLQAWTVVVGSWCCMFASMGWINCIGVFQDYYEQNQLSSYSPSTVAWISSTETFMMFLGAPVFGKIFDNFGPRYMLLAGTVCHVLGLMMTSLASKYYQFFLAQAILSALGASALFYGCLNPIGTWFFKKRAFAFGIIAAGASLAGVILPIMIARLIPRVGFGWSMRAVAFLFLGLLAISNLTIRSRLPPKPTPVALNQFLVPFTELPFLCVALGSFFFFWGVFLPTNFIILEAQHDGMSHGLSEYLLSILNAGSVLGRILPGWLGDRVGRFNVMIVTTYLTSIIVLALWIPGDSNVPIIIFAALFGFTSGTFVSMVPAIVAQVTKDIRTIGVRNGSNFFIISLAALTGNPIAGVLVTRDGGGYLYLQIFCGVTMFVGSTFFLLARVVQVGWVWKRI
ncbi:riboflavin transporter MCH5 [Aspergillus sclerotioniger CBS 115572]|uniref:Riboflavin transporter MCH5 n=1 Tax=Aspergillus sclerotioniger CBS 115572 TaxID=1450535 RepID=A0A317VQ53_9EURO|nr:riboflavin transporter MCH5 [Aspergillus sclerotioniger CBS 115572]PWY76493.1 riboflavin transporter MCH5 [Aspergillus sclerotioniger CBS 115572]